MFRALKGKLIVKVFDKTITSESGIIITLSEQEQPYGWGEVVSTIEVPDISKGDKILFDDCMIKNIFEIDEEKYIKLDPKDIICKIINDKPAPILNKVLIDVVSEYDTSKGGIVIPEEYRDGSCFGKVIAVGNGKISLKRNRVPMRVLIGEMVLFSQWKKLDIEIKGKKYTLTRDESILCVIDNMGLTSRIEQSKWRK